MYLALTNYLTEDRRDKHTRDLFKDIKQPSNVLNYLLTPHEIHGDKKAKLRHPYLYALSRAKTLRLSRSFAYCIDRQF